MATISSTRSIPNPGFNSWTSKVELDTNTGNQVSYVYGGSGKLLYNGTPQEVVSTIPRLSAYATDKAFFDGLISTIDEQSASLTAQYQQQVPPQPTEPVNPTTENTPDNNNLGGTPASDDSSYDKNNAAYNASKSNLPTVYGSNETETLNESFAGKTTAGTADNTSNNPVQKNVGLDPKPGTRIKNPLGNFSSYTYQISLYMITPDAHSAFVRSGRKNINAFLESGASSGSGGAYVILQSGGVNTNLNKRPPGMPYDYYIDDLRITNAVATQQTSTSSNITKITFNVIEPYGFSFITKLKRAREALVAKSTIPNISKATNASKQFFVLGIRFQGYDANGEIANASKYFSDDTFNASPDASGVYERFYDILLESIKFKLSGGSTVYNIVAKNIASEIGLQLARGTVNQTVDLVADTVGNALNGSGKGITSLFQTMNTNLEKSKSREFPDVYNVRFVGTGVEAIENATLKSDANTDKKASAPNNANNLLQVNETTSQTAVYDKQKIKINIKYGTSVLEAIQKIIKQSSYLEKALRVVYKSEETPNEDTGSSDVVIKKDTPSLRWYNVSTDVEVIGYDTKINDFAYKITYVIQPYDTPAAISPYGRTSKYYGPHKRYEYWYTGQNTEILSYEQQFDNTFFNVVYNPKGDPATSGGNAKIPQMSNQPTNENHLGRLDKGNEAQNTYMTSLYDPGAYAEARIQILGDPDFLMRETATGLNEVYKQFYQSDGFTINPNGGEVFIEIAFNEGIDYNAMVQNNDILSTENNTGLMTLNRSIFFWDYPDNIRGKINGVSYKVRECESVFKGGKFTQTLQLNINTMPEAVDAAQQAAENNRETNQNTQNSPIRPINTQRTGTIGAAETPSASGAVSSNTGLKSDEITQLDNALQSISTTDLNLQRELKQNTFSSRVSITNNSNNPIVADDDSVSNAGSTQAGVSNQSGTNAAIITNQNNILTDARNGLVN